MRALLRRVCSGAGFFLTLLSSAPAAPALTAQIDPVQVNVGDHVTITVTVENGGSRRVLIPPIDCLQQAQPGIVTTNTYSWAGGTLTNKFVQVSHFTATKAGDFTIPPIESVSPDGTVLRSEQLTLHVAQGAAPATNTAPAVPKGPVVMPPPGQAAPQNPANAIDNDLGFKIPRDPDGGPAKVFIVITPTTQDAYVNQAVPLRIDFFIRMEVNADQNSLPTIKGSDFLMDNFSIRGHASLVVVEGQQYECDTWLSSISAPKPGDFPLAMERDTYWVKAVSATNLDPFAGLFGRRQQNLAHEFVTSNQLTMHISALPTDGRPDSFTGAIGEFSVSATADPTAVAVGEPVGLKFVITGEGNFDYVHCPTLADDPAWKPYVPHASTSYPGESHVRATKQFAQSIIPQKSGVLPLPAVAFSYFDPTRKEYVNVPLSLPAVTVTGGSLPAAAAPTPAGNDAAPAVSPMAGLDLAPNRSTPGSPRTDFVPVYRHPWFWIVEGGALLLPFAGAFGLLLQMLRRPDAALVERARRRRSVQQEESAMTEAAGKDDVVAFFHAARHAIQLQLGAEWRMQPEAITLGEVRRRDPQLAESLAPLFKQADEVIYSGRAPAALDLAQWDRDVRDLLKLQPA